MTATVKQPDSLASTGETVFIITILAMFMYVSQAVLIPDHYLNSC